MRRINESVMRLLTACRRRVNIPLSDFSKFRVRFSKISGGGFSGFGQAFKMRVLIGLKPLIKGPIRRDFASRFCVWMCTSQNQQSRFFGQYPEPRECGHCPWSYGSPTAFWIGARSFVQLTRIGKRAMVRRA